MADPTEAPTVAANAKQEELSALDAERALGRNIAIGLPLLTVVGSIAAGFAMSIGPAILVLAAGAIVGAIALFWTSLRTLAGDAALPEELELMAARPFAQAPADARKRTLLRAIKDLEHDHAVGKIDREDYEELAARYREEAKAAMREMDALSEPLRKKAEEVARQHLAKRGLGGKGAKVEKTAPVVDDVDDVDAEDAPVAEARKTCPSCATSNDHDATFCKKCGTALTAPAAAGASAEE